jgi:zinc finger CCHC domain-containing protein 9
MTRITNIGRKRTYVEAGFKNALEGAASVHKPTVEENMTATSKEDNGTTDAPPKKKRKRTKKPKAHAGDSGAPTEIVESGVVDQIKDVDNKLETEGKSKKSRGKPNQKKNKSKGALPTIC